LQLNTRPPDAPEKRPEQLRQPPLVRRGRPQDFDTVAHREAGTRAPCLQQAEAPAPVDDGAVGAEIAAQHREPVGKSDILRTDMIDKIVPRSKPRSPT